MDYKNDPVTFVDTEPVTENEIKDLKYGIPKQRKPKAPKVEYFPEMAVMTILPTVGKNKRNKILFNEKACNMLGISKGFAVSFAFDGGNAYMSNTTADSGTIPKYTCYSNSEYNGLHVADSTLVNYIKKEFKLNTNNLEHFMLTPAKLRSGFTTASFKRMVIKSSQIDSLKEKDQVVTAVAEPVADIVI